MISNIATQSFTTSASSSAPQQAYFSTLDAAFVYIREYIEDNMGENISVCVKETTLCINGKEKDFYEVSFGAAPQYALPQVPYTPYVPQVPNVAPQGDEWWKTPIVYCGPTPQVTLNEGVTVGSDSCIDVTRQTKAGGYIGAVPQVDLF